jgi:hypothetical protein
MSFKSTISKSKIGSTAPTSHYAPPYLPFSRIPASKLPIPTQMLFPQLSQHLCIPHSSLTSFLYRESSLPVLEETDQTIMDNGEGWHQGFRHHFQIDPQQCPERVSTGRAASPEVATYAQAQPTGDDLSDMVLSHTTPTADNAAGPPNVPEAVQIRAGTGTTAFRPVSPSKEGTPTTQTEKRRQMEETKVHKPNTQPANPLSAEHSPPLNRKAQRQRLNQALRAIAEVMRRIARS